MAQKDPSARPPVSCIVFDFDGTVGNSRDLIWKIFNELADKYGFRRLEAEDFERARGMTKPEFVRFVGVSKLKIPRLLIEGRQMMAEEIKTIRCFEHVKELLPTLRERVRTLGILSSNSASNIRAVLKQEDLDVFDFISTVPRLSRKHKNLKAVLKTFSYEPEEILYLGDETRDMNAGRKAGVKTIGVDWGFNSAEALKRCSPAAVISEPRQILDFLP